MNHVYCLANSNRSCYSLIVTRQIEMCLYWSLPSPKLLRAILGICHRHKLCVIPKAAFCVCVSHVNHDSKDQRNLSDKNKHLIWGYCSYLLKSKLQSFLVLLSFSVKLFLWQKSSWFKPVSYSSYCPFPRCWCIYQSDFPFLIE